MEYLRSMFRTVSGDTNEQEEFTESAVLVKKPTTGEGVYYSKDSLKNFKIRSARSSWTQYILCCVVTACGQILFNCYC